MAALEATKSTVGSVAVNTGLPDSASSAVAAAAGGLSAALAAQLVWTPVDVVSQRLMVQGVDGSHLQRLSGYRGGFDAFRKIVLSDGVRGLYRGFGMSILTYAPSNAVWWASYSIAQNFIWEGVGCYLCQYRRGVQEMLTSENVMTPEYKTVMAVQGVSAAVAGGATALVTMPLDTIKTRLQVTDRDEGIGRTLRNLIREGGWSACFRGLGPRWASMSVSATTMITTYEFLKRLSMKNQESIQA